MTTTPLPALVAQLRESADEVMEHPHPSSCDHLHTAHHLMRRAADALEAADAARGAACDYTPGRLDREAPARIWLQIDTSGNNDERDESWPGPDDVTWQDESIGGLEIEYVRADLATPQPGDGLVLVPREPTLAMLQAAAVYQYGPGGPNYDHVGRWKAMIAAAPAQGGAR